jgi:Bacterial transglutaminase-like N-terminal region
LAIQVALNHCSRFRYDKPVSLGPQVARLRPAPHCRTPILSYSMRGLPAKHLINWQQDPHANFLARLLFPEKTQEFVVEVDFVAELSPVNPFDIISIRRQQTTHSNILLRSPGISNPIVLCSRLVNYSSAFSIACHVRRVPLWAFWSI